MAPSLEALTTKIFADGADLDAIVALSKTPYVKGFTTNPTLIRKAGITDYVAFAHRLLEAVPNYPIAFEVFADDFAGIEAQARVIAKWSPFVNVKVPVTTTDGTFTGPVIERLSAEGITVNVTALMTAAQVERVAERLHPDTPAFVSVFAGRVADTGVDPVPVMVRSLDILKSRPKAELIWASPREVLNIFQASAIGCHVITVAHDMLKKLDLIGKDLDEYSLEAVRIFVADATAAGFTIPVDDADGRQAVAV